MATDVKIPAGFRLVSNASTNPPAIPEGFKLVSTPQITPEVQAKVDANNAAYAQKSAELNKEYPFVSLVENKPESLGAKIARPIARGGLLAMQGVANAGLNPAGYVARAAGVDTAPVKPENWVERGIERSGEYGYDAAGIYAGLKGAQTAAEASSIAPSLGKNILNVLTEGGMPTALATSTGSAMLRGYINPRNEFEGWLTDLAGAGIGGALQGAFTRSVVPTKGSLKEALPIDKANAALSKGIKADKTKGIARQINQDAPAVYNSLNDDAAQALDKAIGRKLNIDGALDSQKQRYDNYIGQNADRIVLGENPVPTVTRYKGGDDIAVAKSIRRNMSKDDPNFQWRRDENGNYDYEHFVKDPMRAEYLKTFNSTYKNPQHDIMAPNKDGYIMNYLLREYHNPEIGKNVYDKIVKNPTNGMTVTKFAREGKQGLKEFEKVFKNGLSPQASEAGLGLSQVGNAPSSTLRVNYNIPQNSINVKQNAPTLRQLSEGLSDYQTQVLNDVIQEGADKVTNPKGSLRAVHRALEVLNKRIDNTINENPLRPRAKGDPDVKDLMEVKGRINQALDFGGIKPYDEGMSKAKGLRDAFERGYNFKPSEIKFENLGLKTLRDKKAFLQGYTARLEDNVLSDGGTNLATSIKKGENVLKKVLSKDKFDTLMKDADKIEESFKRLKSLEGQANREVLKETERGGSPYRETFESPGSTKGRLMDMLFGWAGRLGSKRLANAYLNPEIDSIKQFGGLKGALKGAGAADTRQLMIDLLNGAE